MILKRLRTDELGLAHKTEVTKFLEVWGLLGSMRYNDTG